MTAIAHGEFRSAVHHYQNLDNAFSGLSHALRFLDKSQPKGKNSFFIITRIGSGQTNGKQRCATGIFHEGTK
jgi:hypothetical protein